MHFVLHALQFLKKREYNNSFTPQQGIRSVLKTQIKEEEKTIVQAKDECEKVRRREDNIAFQRTFFEQTSASQGVSLFTN